MKYTYEDIVTAKDVLTGRVNKEDIIGKKGWFLDCIPRDMSLNTIVRLTGGPETLKDFNADGFYSFVNDKGCVYIYFLPEKGPSYKERQAEWLKKNEIKAGTRVRITRVPKDYEDGWENTAVPSEMMKFTNTVNVITTIWEYDIRVDNSYDFFSFPFFVLEKIEDDSFAVINPRGFNIIQTRWNHDKDSVARGKFLTWDDGKFIAADNSSGDFFVEKFDSYQKAADWLAGKDMPF